MHVIHRYAGTAAEAEACVRTNPFAILVSGVPPIASQLPLLVEGDLSSGARLLGHFARANPHVSRLRDDPLALAVFTGPHGYVSPSWLTDRTQAPTWNYVSVHVATMVRLHDDTAFTEMVVDRLTDTMESDRPNEWSIGELGIRRSRLLTAIIGFEAEVLSVESQFRLSQYEPALQVEEIATGFASEGHTALATAIRAARPRDR